jgi:hypothetical protein
MPDGYHYIYSPPSVECLAQRFSVKKVKIAERGIVYSLGIIRISIPDISQLQPLRRVLLNPFGKQTMADTGHTERLHFVTRIDDDKSAGVGKERRLIAVKHAVLNQGVQGLGSPLNKRFC